MSSTLTYSTDGRILLLLFAFGGKLYYPRNSAVQDNLAPGIYLTSRTVYPACTALLPVIGELDLGLRPFLVSIDDGVIDTFISEKPWPQNPLKSCSSEVECLPNVHQTLGSIPSTTE